MTLSNGGDWLAGKQLLKVNTADHRSEENSLGSACRRKILNCVHWSLTRCLERGKLVAGLSATRTTFDTFVWNCDLSDFIRGLYQRQKGVTQ